MNNDKLNALNIVHIATIIMRVFVLSKDEDFFCIIWLIIILFISLQLKNTITKTYNIFIK
jgi:hypothetical protein